MKIIFAGTPDFAALSLRQLIESQQHEIVAVYTQPDRPAGRGRKLKPSPVKSLALEHSIPVQQPTTLKTEEQQQILADYQADLMIVVAYGMLLPKAVLDIPKLGCINVHASLLPRWRGAAPIQRAIAAGDQETGVTIMQMDVGLDTGDMLLKVVCPINDDETGGSLHDKLAEIGASALMDALQQIDAKQQQGELLVGEKQDDSLATYAHKLSKEEGKIDWGQSAIDIQLHIRAFNPFPVCHTHFGDETVRIWQAKLKPDLDQEASQASPGTIVEVGKKSLVVATGEGALSLTTLQWQGGKALSIVDVLNSKRSILTVGSSFQ